MENFQLSDFLTHYDDYILLYMFSRHAEKYVRRGKLDWPVGATSRESIKAVTKLPRLQVCYFLTCVKTLIWSILNLFLTFFLKYFQNLIMQHVDHSAGDLIHLLQGLLRYDPLERITAKEALRHSFFMRRSH